MINNIYTSQRNLELNARRVKRLGNSFGPTIGDSDVLSKDDVKNKSFGELKTQLETIIENETGYRGRLNPKIAVALTAANGRQPKPIKAANDAAQSYETIKRLK